MNGEIIILENDGKFLRSFKITNSYESAHFAVNSLNEILYPRRMSSGMVAFDLTGKVLYTDKERPFFSGENVTPYSKYMISNSYHPVEKSNIYQVDNKRHPKSVIYIDGEFSSLGPKGANKNKGSKYIFLADGEGSLFVRTLTNVNPRKFAYSYHASDGSYIQTLQNPPDLNEKVLGNRTTIDKDGNFYLMRIYYPEGAEIIDRKLVKGGVPCLRIWKWERIKE
ncbi:hypothetical protein ACFL40_00420 [candidate division KSB1 bacterium]